MQAEEIRALLDSDVAAEWTNDCQGKKDYDGAIIEFSTRYWPGPSDGGSLLVSVEGGSLETETIPYGPRPSAHCQVLAAHGESDWTVLAEQEFEADTEAETKQQVEEWVKSIRARILKATIEVLP